MVLWFDNPRCQASKLEGKSPCFGECGALHRPRDGEAVISGSKYPSLWRGFHLFTALLCCSSVLIWCSTLFLTFKSISYKPKGVQIQHKTQLRGTDSALRGTDSAKFPQTVSISLGVQIQHPFLPFKGTLWGKNLFILYPYNSLICSCV